MRCPSCGTENAPDSRFCGGCGARTTTSVVAPTQKISDDAPMPPQQAYSIPPSNYSIPPQNSGPASLPPPPSIAPVNRGPISMAPTSRNPQSIPPGNNPASIPPTNNPYVTPTGLPPTSAFGSQPPHARAATEPAPHGGTIQRPATAPPVRAASPAPAPSLSMPRKKPSRTRWGVVLFVLALDIGLAATGAWLLRAGLADTSHSETPSP
jgi:zinc ribbon protein